MVPILIDSDCAHRGIFEQDERGRPIIKLREWDERVLLHETLHAFVAAWRKDHWPESAHILSPNSSAEEMFVRHLTHLYELGWRPSEAS